MLKVLAAGICAKRSRACIKASCRGLSSFRPGDAFAGRGEGGFGELSELPAINKRFEDILLDIQVIVDDGRHLVTQSGKMLDSLVYPVIGEVVTWSRTYCLMKPLR